MVSRTVVDGLLAGKHRSTTRGGSSEFAQHRQYAPGDDVRQIDWQVFARNDRHYIRQFEEETNLSATLAVDTSGSMGFAHSTLSKLDYGKKLAACLARLLLRQRDAVGTSILRDPEPLFLPPKQHAAHLRAVLSSLQMATANSEIAIANQIRSCVSRLGRRGLFVLISDCFGNLDDLAQALRTVRARGHDVVVFNVLAPEEIHFQFRHWSSFQSLEVAGQRLNLNPATIREEYLKRVKRFLEDLEQTVTGIGGDYLRMTTNQNLADVLGWFLRSRIAGT